MERPDEIELYFWSFTMSMLILFIVLSLLIYRTNKRKMYLFYGLYCLFTLVYLSFYNKITSISPFLKSHDISEFTIYIQFWFHAMYMHFGIRFLGFDIHYPRFLKFSKVYIIAFLSLATLVFLLQNFNILPSQSARFCFYKVFVPIHLIVAIVIITKSLRTKEDGRFIFLTGSFLYIFFVLIALFTSGMSGRRSFIIQPMVYFMIGIILECLFISYGLGYKIRKLYINRQFLQTQLNVMLEEEKTLRVKEKQWHLQEKQEQELQTQMADLQQKVLRSQINSHFIFNVLNSIKVFIIDNDNKNAVKYLNKFANFIRLILDGTIKDNVSLEEELNSIELLLSIEKMRFYGRFSYRIEIENPVKLSTHFVPAFILQPFVENALWHGIMNKEDEGILLISVTENQDHVLVEIDDNGVGYNAGLLNRKKSHHSIGLSLVEDRINHHNLNTKNTLHFSIFDKMELGTGEGTLVKIYLKKR